MRGADVMELLGHDVFGQFGLVAFAAQMREIKVAQFGGHDERGGFGGGDIGKMAVTTKNPLLQTPRTARAILQHFHVMIGFEDEHVRGADAVEHHFRRVAEIGGETDVAARGAQEKSDRILRVVRNGKCFDGQIVEFKIVAGLK